MKNNISLYAGILFLCLLLFLVGKSIHPYQCRFILKVAINVLSLFLIVICTFTVWNNVNKIRFGNYITMYLITFIASWLCFFSNTMTRITIGSMNNLNESIPMSFFALGSLFAMIIGFIGFPIIRTTQREDYKALGYFLSAFILVVSAVVVWIFGLPLYALFFENLTDAFIK
jgi:hypothetical protein